MPVDKFGRMDIDAKTIGDGVPLAYINNNFLRKDGTTKVTGSINMDGNTLTKVSNPTNPQDVATKDYVDTSKGKGFLKRNQDGNIVVKKDLDMDGNKLLNIPFPENDGDAVNRIYVDSKSNQLRNYFDGNSPFVIAPGDANGAGNKFQTQNNLHMMNFKIKELGEPTEETDAANKKYVDSVNAFTPRDDDGWSAKGTIFLASKKLGGLRTPINGREAANKEYVDDTVKEYVDEYVGKFKDENGNFVTSSDVNMKNKKLFGLPTPTAQDDAANKEYVDRVGNNAKEYTDRTSVLLGRNIADIPTPFLKDNGNYVPTLPISMAAQSLTNLPIPQEDNDAATKKYVDDTVDKNREPSALTKTNIVTDDDGNEVAVLLGKGPHYVAQGVIGSNHRIALFQDSFIDSDAVNKKYVDTLVADNVRDGAIPGIAEGTVFFKENGNYQATENINMGFKQLLNLPRPVNPGDGANKKYVDDAVSVRKPIICVTAYLYGPDILTLEGFRLPDGGYKIITEPTYFEFNFGTSSIEFKKKELGMLVNQFIPPTHGRLIGFNTKTYEQTEGSLFEDYIKQADRPGSETKIRINGLFKFGTVEAFSWEGRINGVRKINYDKPIGEIRPETPITIEAYVEDLLEYEILLRSVLHISLLFELNL